MDDSNSNYQKSKDQPSSDSKTEDTGSVKKHNSKMRFIIMMIIVVIAVGLALLWYNGYRKYITSDDANLDTYRIDIAPQVTGVISKLYVNEGDTVKSGDILFEIDSKAMQSRLEQAQAQHKQSVSEISVYETELAASEKQLELTKVAAALVEKNFKRAKMQYSGDAISLEEFQNWEENWKSAQLKIELAKNSVLSSRASLESAILASEASNANVSTMLTDMSYYKVYAPDNGIIGKRWLLAGDIVNAGQNVFTLNKGKDIWVAVFLEETKFKNIYLGQDVKFTLDAYDKLTFHGKIYYIGDNAASEFALVPPSNASGNYTKVTQRIPIKISIDGVDGDKKQLNKYKLVSGMSANIKIIKE